MTAHRVRMALRYRTQRAVFRRVPEAWYRFPRFTVGPRAVSFLMARSSRHGCRPSADGRTRAHCVAAPDSVGLVSAIRTRWAGKTGCMGVLA